MKKYILLFFIAGLAACDDTDNIFLNGITVTEVISDYPDMKSIITKLRERLITQIKTRLA